MGNYVFQQDSAPAHKAKITQKFMDENFSDYWPWALWPPSSPDCNPLDYVIWGLLDTKVGANPHPNIKALKATISSTGTVAPPPSLPPCPDTVGDSWPYSTVKIKRVRHFAQICVFRPYLELQKSHFCNQICKTFLLRGLAFVWDEKPGFLTNFLTFFLR